jgi:hypothetical protein
MARFNPLCSFIISASWPFFIFQFLIIEIINPGMLKGGQLFYPIPSLLVIGVADVISGYLWQYLGRDPFEFYRFMGGALIGILLGALVFYRIIAPKDRVRWFISVVVSYVLLFILVFFIEKTVCENMIFSPDLIPPTSPEPKM